MSLQFTHGRFFALPNFGADSSAVGLCCVTITTANLQRFTSSYDSRPIVACCCWTL